MTQGLIGFFFCNGPRQKTVFHASPSRSHCNFLLIALLVVIRSIDRRYAALFFPSFQNRMFCVSFGFWSATLPLNLRVCTGYGSRGATLKYDWT